MFHLDGLLLHPYPQAGLWIMWITLWISLFFGLFQLFFRGHLGAVIHKQYFTGYNSQFSGFCLGQFAQIHRKDDSVFQFSPD